MNTKTLIGIGTSFFFASIIIIIAFYVTTLDMRTFTDANLNAPNRDASFTKVNNLAVATRVCVLSTSGNGSLDEYLSAFSKESVTIDAPSIATSFDDNGQAHCTFNFTNDSTGISYYGDALYADPYIDTFTIYATDRSTIIQSYGN